MPRVGRGGVTADGEKAPGFRLAKTGVLWHAQRHPFGWRFCYALSESNGAVEKTLSLFFVDRFLAGIYTEHGKRNDPFVTKQ